jgi:hypothetical protein
MVKKDKEYNSMGNLNAASLKRAFKAQQEKKEKKSKDTEKNQAKREIFRLKKDLKKPGMDKENIEHGIKVRKNKHKIK